jgi:hypothetical protein
VFSGGGLIKDGSCKRDYGYVFKPELNSYRMIRVETVR